MKAKELLELKDKLNPEFLIKLSINQLNELNELLNEDEAKNILGDRVPKIQSDVKSVKDYMIETEDLAAQAMALKKSIAHDEKCLAELKEIFDVYRTSAIGPLESIEEAHKREKQKKRIKDLLCSMSDDFTRGEFEKFDFSRLKKENSRAISRNIKEREKLDRIYGKIQEKRARVLEGVPHEEEFDGAEHGLNNDNDEMNNLQESIKIVEGTKRFKEIIEERNEYWNKIAEIKRVRIQTGKYRTDASKLKKLKEEMREKDNFVRSYIHEFASNKDYPLSDELVALIGVKETTNFRTTLGWPTVKQHLEPIEGIEKKLEDDRLRGLLKIPEEDREKLSQAPHITSEQRGLYEKLKILSEDEKKRLNDLSPLSKEEIDKLKKEKEEREKRLGKRWIIKLKMDVLEAEIKQLEKELKTATPERKKEIEALLLAKRGELEKLGKEYGEILSQIGELVAETVEKTTLEKNGVKSFEDLKKKLEPAEEVPAKDGDEKKDGSKNERSDSVPNRTVTSTSTVGGTMPTGGVGIFGATATDRGTTGSGGASSLSKENESKKNLPATKKSLKDKILGLFDKEEVIRKKEPYKVIDRQKLEYDFASQYAMFPHAKVEGKYFYHTIKKDDEILYVKEPLENMKCTKRDLIKKIKELQNEHKGKEFVKDYDHQRTGILGKLSNLFKDRTVKEIMDEAQYEYDNILNSNARIILAKYLGASVGEERRLRMLNMMCGLEAAHLTQEVIEAFNSGIGKEQFNPGVKKVKKKAVFVERKETEPEFEEIIKSINDRGKEKGSEEPTPVVPEILRDEHLIPEATVTDVATDSRLRKARRIPGDAGEYNSATQTPEMNGNVRRLEANVKSGKAIRGRYDSATQTLKFNRYANNNEIGE